MPVEAILILFLSTINFIILKNYNYITKKLNIFDIPNEKRKIHSKPTPLFGGVIIYINIVAFFLFFLFYNFDLILSSFLFSEIKSLNYFFLIISTIFIIGLYDDKYTVSGINRIIFLGILIYFSILINHKLEIYDIIFNSIDFSITLSKASKIFPLICFLVLIISCNLGDGINFQSFLFNFFCFLGLFFVEQNLFILTVLFSLICFGLLNFKGKVFLGDSGSYLLSFLLAFFFIIYYNYNYLGNVETIILFLFFPVLDATRCILLRLISGRSIMSADNLHLHYILLKKIGYYKTIYILSIFYSGPFIVLLLDLNLLYFFILFLIFYLFLILKFK